MKKFVKKLAVISVISLSAITFSGCDAMFYALPTSFSYESYGSYNPAWAPDYYNGARYYYLPDVECYYDLSSRNFIMLRNGQWQFVSSLNSYYPSFDLNTSFVVVLNSDVYRPWLYDQYYRSHYPRYYYRDYYDHSNIPYVRGFNENNRSAIYWSDKNRNNARTWDNRYMNSRDFRYSDSDRRMQQETTTRGRSQQYNSSNSNQQSSYSRNQTNQSARRRNNTQNRSTNVNSGSQTNYSGKTIGQPVKVERNMRAPATNSQNSNSSHTKSNSSSGRR